jgi:hypothetical protein
MLLSAIARQTDVAQLAGFCHYAPNNLVMIALADFQPTHWDRIPVSEPMLGASWVAARCADVGREDLQSALVTTLLRRASPQDFPPRGMALANVAWLLAHTPAAGNALVPSFLKAICKKTWLRRQFMESDCGPLSTGLRMLALHQPLRVRQHFHDSSLKIRLQNELSRFSQVIQEEQSLITQFLGCTTLFGLSAKGNWFNNIRLNAICKLPVETLPHRAEATKVEDWQFQLWLGLSAVTEVTGKPLAVPLAVIVRTLDLWRVNLAESSLEPESAEHRVNQRIITWLESCVRANQGLVPPKI